MADPAKSETAPKLDEDRLAHALISRGLLTREEAQQCRGTGSVEAYLKRLVEAGCLTANQAKRAVQEMNLLLGQQIPGYQLLEKLGQGATGIVFKARQLSMNRLVAIKVLHARLVRDTAFVQRLVREAHLAAKLSHNNIVQAIDVGTAGHIHYLVMEYVEGTTIRQELDAGKKYEEKEALEIIVQVAQALDHAHRRGLLHRDIKPANIILTPDGVAKLADLGLARERTDEAGAKAEKGLIVGTPYYMAPEQILRNDSIDVRADIYSLGATLYHMVTGQPPFPGPGIDAVLQAHLKDELTPPDHINTQLSSGLGEVVEFTMAKDRRQRYRTPADLIIDLECLLSGEPPKLARQRIEATTLRGLAEGEVDEDEEEEEEEKEEAGWLIWVYVLGGLLGMSVLLNLVLFLRH